MDKTDGIDRRKVWTTVAFVVVVGGVVGTFAFLGTQDRPPPMPAAGPHHQLRFNLKNELIGVETDPPVDVTAPSAPGFVYDEKAVTQRINAGCRACHGGPGQGLPEHHPPKSECIKCHRQPPRTAPAATR